MGRILVAALLLCGAGVGAQAQDGAWQAEKCRLYENAWARALEAVGSDDLNYNFVATNENFIASGCTEPVRSCPQSGQEIEIANLLSIVMMNEGTASTFLPFGCPSAADSDTSFSTEAEILGE